MLLRSSSTPLLTSLLPPSCQLDHHLPPPPDLPLDIPSHRLPPPSPLRTTTSSSPITRFSLLHSEQLPQIEKIPGLRRARSEGDLHGFASAASAQLEHNGDRCQGASVSGAVCTSVREEDEDEEETHDSKASDADFSVAMSSKGAKESAFERRRIGSIGGSIGSSDASTAQIRVSVTTIDGMANDPVLADSFGIEQDMGESLNLMCMASGVGICRESDGYLLSSNHGGNGKGGGGHHKRSDGENFYGDSDTTELYYQNLLREDPQNPLLLRNYAQFLSETKRDFRKSEEYYERAILASPNDGEVLSKYAKHVWDTHKDQDRAEGYFERAVHATPDDCYVLASYASFLWESDDAEAESDALPHTQHEMLSGHKPLIVSV